MRRVVGNLGVFWHSEPGSLLNYIAIFDKESSGKPGGGYAWRILLGKHTLDRMIQETKKLLPDLNHQRSIRDARSIPEGHLNRVIQDLLA